MKLELTLSSELRQFLSESIFKKSSVSTIPGVNREAAEHLTNLGFEFYSDHGLRLGERKFVATRAQLFGIYLLTMDDEESFDELLRDLLLEERTITSIGEAFSEKSHKI